MIHYVYIDILKISDILSVTKKAIKLLFPWIWLLHLIQNGMHSFYAKRIKYFFLFLNKSICISFFYEWNDSILCILALFDRMHS